ncbi:MAG: PEP-CTERM sorting domain-containing protein, partial [Minwuiales bacterium]|nr:PEP-CTERM sorting domain-containing protein [Minwuiales bacterium]
GVRVAPIDTNVGIDGFGPDELLRFTFSKTVTLVSMVFQDVESNDEFDMAVDDMDVDVSALLGTDDIGALPNGGFGSDSNLADFTGAGLIGTVFDFYTTEADDDYLIRALTVDVAHDAADVPAPGALMLLGFGLAGLSLARRRRAETPAVSPQASV